MDKKREFDPIAYIRTGFPTKFGIPRQSGITDTKGRIVFEPQYRVREAFRGLEEYSHIWVLWEFSEAIRKEWSPTVRPPRLGGNSRMGVFATRSPFRPNPIGLSCLELEKIEWNGKEGPVLIVKGIDLMDGTPIYDIKPYLPYVDCFPEARTGFAGKVKDYYLPVVFEQECEVGLTKEEKDILIQILRQDPRPAYQNDAQRIYGMEYGGLEVKFFVAENILRVVEIEKKK